jgi:hypothetical protein
LTAHKKHVKHAYSLKTATPTIHVKGPAVKQQIPNISAFIKPYPPMVQNLKLVGLRLVERTTVHVTICEDGGTRHMGIFLSKENAEAKEVEARHMIILSGEIFLDQLPETMVSTVALAGVVGNANTEGGLAEIIDNAFAAVISHLGKVVISLGEDTNVGFSVTIGQFVGASQLPMAELDDFFEERDHDACVNE